MLYRASALPSKAPKIIATISFGTIGGREIPKSFSEVPWTDQRLYNGLVHPLAKGCIDRSSRLLFVQVWYHVFSKYQEQRSSHHGHISWRGGRGLRRVLWKASILVEWKLEGKSLENVLQASIQSIYILKQLSHAFFLWKIKAWGSMLSFVIYINLLHSLPPTSGPFIRRKIRRVFHKMRLK